jgi:hypothetical protein
LSLPIAERGAKAHLRKLWEATSFDLENSCRRNGRNDSFWILCVRRQLDGEQLPDEKERLALVRAANRATGGLNVAGERERYTSYEAQATIDQVASYSKYSHGLRPLVASRRRWAATSRSRYATPPARRLLEAICDVASACWRVEEIRASHRQLARAADVHPTEVASLLRSLQAAGQVFRLGFTSCYKGRPRGTTRLSLKPPRPAQNLDELHPPTWDPRKAQWTWSTPLEKGTISQKRWRWRARREAERSRERALCIRLSKNTAEIVDSTFSTSSQTATEALSSRGSP